MAKKKKISVKAAPEPKPRPIEYPERIGRTEVVIGTTDDQVVQGKFIVSSYTLNRFTEENKDFPGNINPEGYFYEPFHEVALKEIDDNLQFINTKRINFVPSAETTSVNVSSVTFYESEAGYFTDKYLTIINLKSPISYPFIVGMPFSIYDIYEEVTYRGYLDQFKTDTDGASLIRITTESKIDQNGLNGNADESGNKKSRYIIALLDENAPEYAEYIPSTGRLVWRGPKKMSDLDSTSPLYNMPFTNGRLYIHNNINVFVRRQDPQGDRKLYAPSGKNPLQRFQIEGNPRIDFDAIKIIIDSMVDAC